MNCDEVRQRMIEGLDREGDEQAFGELAEHFARCDDCQGTGEEMRLMHGRLVAAANAARRESIVDGVMERIGAGRQKQRGVRRIGWALAACAAIAIGACVVIFFASGTVSFAEVKLALAAQTWIHIRHDSGQIKEEWIRPGEGISFATRFDGDVVFVDQRTNRRRVYSVREASISEDEPRIYAAGTTPDWKPATVADYWAQTLDRMSKHPADYESHDETIDGRRMVRCDSYGADSLGKRMIFEQLWVDAATRLPVKDRERLQLAEREEWHREWTSGEYDYPSTGPGDIYELGVPKTAPVVSRLAGSISPQVRELIDRAKVERAKFPQQYRVVCWQDSRLGMIDIIYQDGKKLRQERYFRMPKPGADGLSQGPIESPVTEEKILEWVKAQTPIEADLIDGERQYSRQNQFAAPATHPTVQVMMLRGDFDLLANNSRPAEMMWPFLNRAGPMNVIEKSDDAPPGCIGFRVGGEGNDREDFFVDPQKGLACVKQIVWEKRGTDWEKRREVDLDDLHLVGGQWCPGKRIIYGFADSGHGISVSQSTWIVAVQLLDEGDFPPRVFDSQTLMKGAKVEGY